MTANSNGAHWAGEASNNILNSPVFQPITITVSAWNGDRVTPGQSHFLSVTVSNRGHQDAVVQVSLESISPWFRQWCTQTEQWLALEQGNSGELRFEIPILPDTAPQWFDYEVVVRAHGAYRETFLPTVQRRLQILAPEQEETSQDPTFSLTPITTPDRPVIVQLGQLIEFSLRIENRSQRVDRFRLELAGLSQDWQVEIEYPRDYEGMGLVRDADSLGVNPGDVGTIIVRLTSPALPLAGDYLPTLRLRSQNLPDLGLLAVVYLQVKPTYQLQAQLESPKVELRHRRPAEFKLQLANLGNTPRHVQINLQNLSETGYCRYHIAEERITLASQSMASIQLQGQPQRWWHRPWWGFGKSYPFRLQLTDASTNPQAIMPAFCDGQILWMPRPWWQLLLSAMLGLGLIGTISFLIWWNFLRPPVSPQVLEFSAEDSQYSEATGDMARLRWQIKTTDQIHQLKLTGINPEGQVSSGPLVYEFQDGKLPETLQQFCQVEKDLLSCNQVRSDAFAPGKYLFELALIPKDQRLSPIAAKTQPVEIIAKPLPQVTMFEPESLTYQETLLDSGNRPSPNAPIITSEGVRLNWSITAPEELAALSLVGRDRDGKVVGNLWFKFPASGELPALLKPHCKIDQAPRVLTCQRFPSRLKAAGEYRFELQPLTDGQTEQTATKPKVIESIKIEPPPPQIASLMINGKEAPAKILLSWGAGQPIPVARLTWRVIGSPNTQVELSPAPGRVPMLGAANFPIGKIGNTVLELQVQSPNGGVIKRSIVIEVYDP